MAVQAILGAFLAALGNMIMLVRSSRFTLPNLAVAIGIANQRLSANPQAAVLLQGLSLLSASNTRNIKPPVNGRVPKSGVREAPQ